jgi:sugar phosphate isomerase/epimerase
MAYEFRQSICNEVYQGWPFHEACRSIRQIGYTGIEIAPFTLSETPVDIPLDERRQYRGIMSSDGLRFVGLHWLMVAPKGLHVTTPDEALREKSWQHIRDLVDLCADLGDGGVMVFGSPHQRSTTGGSSVEDATRRFEEGLAAVSGHAMERGVTILVEALPSSQCDVVGTLAEAARIVQNIGSPAIRTMFDTHNAADETEPHAAVIERYFDLIRHVHVNEMDGKHPGTGDYDFKPVLDVLRRKKYTGWVSLEAFDFAPGAERIATESLRHLESEIAKLPQ